MWFRRKIPTILTLGNMLCGLIGIILVFHPDHMNSARVIAILMATAAILDFADGFVARLLRVSSPLGKELDSLSDLITFGVLPGFLVLKMLAMHPDHDWLKAGNMMPGENSVSIFLMISGALSIPLLSGYRLAKFNVDVRQGFTFYGLPTPANGALWISAYLIFVFDSGLISESAHTHPQLSVVFQPWIISTTSFLTSVLLITDIRLMALKFRGLKWKENELRIIFILISAGTVLLFSYKAVPLIILIYFLTSFIDNFFNRDEIPGDNKYHAP